MNKSKNKNKKNAVAMPNGSEITKEVAVYLMKDGVPMDIAEKVFQDKQINKLAWKNMLLAEKIKAEKYIQRIQKVAILTKTGRFRVRCKRRLGLKAAK